MCIYMCVCVCVCVCVSEKRERRGERVNDGRGEGWNESKRKEMVHLLQAPTSHDRRLF